MAVANPPIKASSVVGVKPAMSVGTRREIIWGLIFLSPWFIGFLAFQLLPILSTFGFSLTDYNPVQPDAVKFIGMNNYARMLADPLTFQSLGVTVKFALIAVPIGLVVPLLFAVLVSSS